MIIPEDISQGKVDFIGQVFDAPLVAKGKTWLPLTQLAAWGIMVCEAGRKRPEQNWRTRIWVGALSMGVMLGSEWCHNLAHAAAAKWVSKPVDCIRVSWGMPLLVYYDTEDPEVTPSQHIIRSLGGPLVNIIFIGIGTIMKRFVSDDSPAREVVNTAIGTNCFLIAAGMTPLPFLDGGAALKWTLVDRGHTLENADMVIRKVNAVSGTGMGAGAAVAFKKNKTLLGVLLSCMAFLSFGVATGLFKEKM
jgi:Zn-dependent protease